MATKKTTKPRKRGRRAQPRATVVLSGGAPNSSLIAGALRAIFDANKTFNNFYTSGAGATIGLLYVVPKGVSTAEAMERTLYAGIHDEIYKRIPLAFKTFYKSGPFTRPIFAWAQRFKVPDPPTGHGTARLYNDLIDLWAAMACPTDLTMRSEGICGDFPFIKEAVDFDRLKDWPGHFFMNAYCIDDGDMVEFGKHEIGPEHFDAALSFPFVYPPAKIGAKWYFEGSSQDPLNLPKLHRRLMTRDFRTETIVLIDILGSLERALIRRPRDLMDAYGISILTPIVSLAMKDLELFRLQAPDVEILPIRFDIPKELYPTVADWSCSNMLRMWEIGLEAGKAFVEAHGDLLPDRGADGPAPVMDE